jgi:hypothetical protein
VAGADRSGDLGDPLAGAGLTRRMLVPAAQRGFDPAGADAGPPRRVPSWQVTVTSAVMIRTFTPPISETKDPSAR